MSRKRTQATEIGSNLQHQLELFAGTLAKRKKKALQEIVDAMNTATKEIFSHRVHGFALEHAPIRREVLLFQQRLFSQYLRSQPAPTTWEDIQRSTKAFSQFFNQIAPVCFLISEDRTYSDDKNLFFSGRTRSAIERQSIQRIVTARIQQREPLEEIEGALTRDLYSLDRKGAYHAFFDIERAQCPPDGQKFIGTLINRVSVLSNNAFERSLLLISEAAGALLPALRHPASAYALRKALLCGERVEQVIQSSLSSEKDYLEKRIPVDTLSGSLGAVVSTMTFDGQLLVVEQAVATAPGREPWYSLSLSLRDGMLRRTSHKTQNISSSPGFGYIRTIEEREILDTPLQASFFEQCDLSGAVRLRLILREDGETYVFAATNRSLRPNHSLEIITDGEDRKVSIKYPPDVPLRYNISTRVTTDIVRRSIPSALLGFQPTDREEDPPFIQATLEQPLLDGGNVHANFYPATSMSIRFHNETLSLPKGTVCIVKNPEDAQQKLPEGVIIYDAQGNGLVYLEVEQPSAGNENFALEAFLPSEKGDRFHRHLKLSTQMVVVGIVDHFMLRPLDASRGIPLLGNGTLTLQ